MKLENSVAIILRELQSESIKNKELTKEQLDIIYDNKWFNIWVPKLYNGLSYSLQDGFDLIKNLAYIDGGLAWTITLCSGANMFAGFIDTELAENVFYDKNVCFGGSGRANGKAVFDGEKFSLTGTWQYATGAPHLSHFTLNAFVYDADIQRIDKMGNPVIYSFFVPREYVLIHYDWNTFGLECTASHSFSLQEIAIDKKYAFQLDPSQRKVDDVIYRIPFLTFAELTLLPNYLGMYNRFLDLVEKYYFDKSKDEYWAQKYSKKRFRQLDQYQQKLEIYSNKSANYIRQVSLAAEQINGFDKEELYKSISVDAKLIVSEIREAVVTLFPLLGITAAQKENEINIVFRNIFTATQHSLLNLVD